MQPEAPIGAAGKRQEKKPEARSGGDSSRYPRKVSRESWRRLKRYVGPNWKIINPGHRRTVWITQTVFFIRSGSIAPSSISTGTISCDYSAASVNKSMRKSLAEYPIWIYILFMRNCKTIVTTAKWGNSIGVRIPSNIANSAGINIGDKIEISNTADGKIIIEKKTKDISELKGFGGLHKYANPSLIPLEKKAFGIMMEEKYGKKTEKS